jgi:hypothetical protein
MGLSCAAAGPITGDHAEPGKDSTMPKYTATIRHWSISQAPVIDIEGTLRIAMLQANKEFGDGIRNHEIVIRDNAGEVVACRRLNDSRWHRSAA